MTPRAAALALAPFAAAAALVVGFTSGSRPAGGASAPAGTPAPAPAPLTTLAWGGDVTLGSRYGQPPDAGWPQFEGLAPALERVDLATVNYEGTFAPGGASKCALAPAPDCFAFQAPARNARTLARAGIDVVNHANNHAWDYGAVGWHSTRQALKAAKVLATGAPGEVVVAERNGTRVAFVGFSTYAWSAPMGNLDDVRALISYAAGRANVVVAFMHAGAEGAGRAHVPLGPETAFGEYRGDSRRFAHAAVDAGADLVLGSGPHVLRGLERYRGRLIAYSLGNLTGWHNFATGGRSALTGLLTVAVGPDGRFLSGSLLSLKLDRTGVPHPDPTRAAARLMRALTASDFHGGRVRIDHAGTISPA